MNVGGRSNLWSLVWDLDADLLLLPTLRVSERALGRLVDHIVGHLVCLLIGSRRILCLLIGSCRILDHLADAVVRLTCLCLRL